MSNNAQFSFEGCIRLLEAISGQKIGPERVELIREIGEKTQKPLEGQVWRVLETFYFGPYGIYGARWREIIILRFGLLDGRKMTFKEISKKVQNLRTKELGVERERIRQIVNYGILSRMQHPSRLKYLEPYFATSLPEAEEVFKELEKIEKSEKQKAEAMRERIVFRNHLLDLIPNIFPGSSLLLRGLIMNKVSEMELTCLQWIGLPEKELVARLGMKTPNSKTEKGMLELQRRLKTVMKTSS